jgi:hypothetical protein
MFPLADLKFLFGAKQAHHGVGRERDIIGPKQEFGAIARGQQYHFVDAFRPG